MKKETIAVHGGQLGALMITVKVPGLPAPDAALCHPRDPHSHPERWGSIFTEKNTPRDSER